MTYRFATLVTFIAALCVLPLNVFSQHLYHLQASIPGNKISGIAVQSSHVTGRPKVGLVLSGGGARGLAQIGVLKILEQHHIPIDLIVGNSLGSVIGGLYAAGYTTAQLESLVTSTNWNDLLSFSEETKRSDLFVGQKESQSEGFLVVRFDGLQPIIPSSISGGQRLSNFFSYLALQALYHPYPTFDDLKIPFRAVATDLISGQRVILDRGSLSEAMRASVAVPLLYAPLLKDSTQLVDGGLTRNIPVDIAKSLGCDVVIVVNSTSPMRTAEQMNAPWEVADQLITIMMQDENKRQLQQADVVFTPEVGGRLVADFSHIDNLIAAGEREGLAHIQDAIDVLEKKSESESPNTGVVLHNPVVSLRGDTNSSGMKNWLRDMMNRPALKLSDVQMYLDSASRRDPSHEFFVDVSDGQNSMDVILTMKQKPVISNYHVEGDGVDYVPNTVFEKQLGPLMGSTLDEPKLQKAFERILAEYRSRGYSLARIESVSIDTSLERLTCVVHAGKIAQIKFEGNARTKDYVIRREFPLDEHDVFNISKAYQGIINIKSTGLFDYVLLDVRYAGDDPTIVLKVKEKSPELMRLGIHADDEHELVTTVDFRDADFRGAWEDLGLRLRYGPRDRLAQFDYTINRIFNSYLTVTMKGYFKSRDVITYTDDPSIAPERWDRIELGRYKESKYGWSFLFGSQFERFGNISAELRIENQKIAAISGQGYIPERYQFVGLKIQSIVDTEDKFWFPTGGMALSLAYESAMKSLGSEVGFGKISVNYETYISFLGRHTLRPKIAFGFADATLPIAEQFSLGGFNSFYGLHEDDSRGRQLFAMNLEYRYRLPFKIIFETYAKVRYDLGTISQLPEELKLINFRHGIGVDMELDTPVGPASVGLGKSFYFRKDLPESPVTVGPLLVYFSLGHSL